MTDMTWWGDLSLPPGRAAQRQIGPSSLWFLREARELQVAIQTETDPISSALTALSECSGCTPPAGHELHRFAASAAGVPVRALPVLADRPVIARPERPFVIPTGAEVTVFISTPIWIELSLNGPLIELPLYRPSDTWFGASTISGELCYGTRTALRMDLTAMPRRPHRAITAVCIRNSGPDSLRLHRIRLPVQHLTLFADENGELWTETLEMIRRDAGEATLSLRPGPLPEAGKTRSLRAPRIQVEPASLLQAITSFLP